MTKKIIGIIGGMGPQATADLYMKIIQNTPVKRDQDHLHVIIDANPQVPDRTKAILGQGESPLPDIVRTALRLEASGVTLGVIPCMTSHYYFDAIQKAVQYPILNILEEIALGTEVMGIKKIGILATTGSVQTKLYDRYLKEVDCLYPDAATQEYMVMEAIYGSEGVKQKGSTLFALEKLKHASKMLVDQGAEAILMGCTEVGLVLTQKELDVPLIDPLDLAAKRLVRLSQEF